MRALLVLAVGLVIVAAQSENSKFSENLRKDNKSVEGDVDPLVASGSDNKDKKVVTIKKHKNYEIVLYEYEDSGEINLSDENESKPVVKNPRPDFNSESNIDSIVPMVWNPVKIPPPVVTTTTTTTTTKKPTTTTTTQRTTTTTTTTQRPTTTTTTTERPTTTTTTTQRTTTSTIPPPAIISGDSGEEYGTDSGDYNDRSDESNKVIRPLTPPQPVQIRPFNSLKLKAVEQGKQSNEETEENQSVAATQSLKPKVETVTNTKINSKFESPEEIPIPKVKLRKPIKSKTTTTTTSTPTPETPPPPPPENILSTEEEDSESEDEDTQRDVFQQNLRQKGGRRIQPQLSKQVSEEKFVPTAEKTFKSRVKVVTQPPEFIKPNVEVAGIEEYPSPRPRFKPNKTQQRQNEKQIPQDDSSSYSEEDENPSPKVGAQNSQQSDGQNDSTLKGILKPNVEVVGIEGHSSSRRRFKPNKTQQRQNEKQVPQDDNSSYSEEDESPDPKVGVQNPQQPDGQNDATLKGILKPNYNIPKTNQRPESNPSFGEAPQNFGVDHPLNHLKRPNFGVLQSQSPVPGGDDYSTSSSSSEEDSPINSRKPIPRPEINRPPQPNVRPRPPKFNWKPKPIDPSNKKEHGNLHSPPEVVPGTHKKNKDKIHFHPPDVSIPISPKKQDGEKFQIPSVISVPILPPKKQGGEKFRPPSELPHFPRFNSSTRPKPTRPFDNLKPTEDDSGSSSSSSSESVEQDESLVCKDPTGKRGICQEYFKCSVLYSNMVGKINLQEYKCPLPTQVGICCPIVEKNAKSRKLMDMVDARDAPLTSQVSKLIRNNLPTSFAFGDNWVDEMEEIERELLARSVTVKRDTPSFGHHKFFPTSKKIRDVSHIGFSLLQTSNDLSERLQLTNEVGGIGLKSFKSSNLEALTDRCPSEPFCPRRKYRTIDGSCNNLGKPKLGQSLTPLSRVLSPAYADGRWEPRRSVQGFDLPSPRLLSQQFIPDHDVPNTRFTLYTMQFGQFVDHDISSVPMFTFGNNSGIDCCQNGQFLPRHLVHPNCFPIEIPRDDPFYSRFGQRCMNLVRSRMAPRIDCSLGYADQMNALTHWLDASNVYGSNEEEARELRSFNRGFLRFSTVPGSKVWLPLKNTGNSREIDYKAGDDRVNEMQGLMITHMVWFREHNRLADELSRLNPHWNDEQLYQESRRIVIAEYQHVIYNEWLPIIIGRDYMDTYGILPLTRDFYKDYDPDVDSSVENSFSAAAFRMGHTLVQGVVRLVNQFGQNDEGVAISQHSENAVRTHAPGQVDKWIRGLVQQPIQNYDPFVTQHLNGRLFQGTNSMFGMDLSSLNIQRGRDHGIPGYNAYRELCQTGIKATTFDDFNDWIPKEMIDKMKRHYVDVDDVDLWIGGLSETPLPGALIGPTFTCIIGDQFARSKKGDRYFYDIGDQPHSFTRAQIEEIRKASFARILCDNSDNLEAIQPSAFLLPDFDFNALMDCNRSNRIPRLDLRAWINEPTP